MTIEDFEHAASIVSGHTAKGCEVVVFLSTGEVSKLWLTNVYPVDIYWISRYLVVPWFCSWVVWSCLHESCFARTFPREAIQHCRNLDGQCLSSTRCLPKGLEQSSDLLFCGAASCCYSLYPRLWFLNIGRCRLHLFHIVFLERQHFITEHCIVLLHLLNFCGDHIQQFPHWKMGCQELASRSTTCKRPSFSEHRPKWICWKLKDRSVGSFPPRLVFMMGNSFTTAPRTAAEEEHEAAAHWNWFGPWFFCGCQESVKRRGD